MKIWVDDVRKKPIGYTIQCYTTDNTISTIKLARSKGKRIELLDLDHDAGKFFDYGGDYIKILDWMEQNEINDIPIAIHSKNPVGVQNMLQIIRKNNWTLVDNL